MTDVEQYKRLRSKWLRGDYEDDEQDSLSDRIDNARMDITEEERKKAEGELLGNMVIKK